MQGSFRHARTATRPAGEWDTLLTPQLDDDTLRRYQRDFDQHHMDDTLSDDSDDSAGGGGPGAGGGGPGAGGGGPGAGGAGMPPNAPDPPPAPPLRFKYKGKTFFVLDEASDVRALQWGQMLVPYTTHLSLPPALQTGILARPYPKPDVRVRIDRLDPRAWPVIKPDLQYCEEGTHYVEPGPGYMQVGRRFLQEMLESAEEMDLQFAKRMEGLTNCAASVVWDCRDPDYNPADRQPVLQQFMAKYMDRFYGQMGLGSTPPVVSSMDEAVRRHKAFCKEWARQHLRSLTPFVTGPAEVLTNMFYQSLAANRGEQGPVATCQEVARLFARHERTTVEFASCLQFFTANLEQSRGNRNASYKQMNQVAMARNHELRVFGAALSRAMPSLVPVFEELRGGTGRELSAYTIDWPDILGQIPLTHRAFDDVAAFGLMPPREQERFGGQPPWRADHP